MKLRWQISLLMIGSLSSLAFPQIRPADDELLDRTTRRILELLPQISLPLPPRLATERDIYLFISAGAATVDIRVLAHPSVSPQKLARIVNSSVKGTGFAKFPVEWSREGNFTIVRLLVRQGRFGQKRATMIVPVGKMVAGLKEANFGPHTLLRLPLHVRTQKLPFLKDKGRFWDWYAISDASPETQVIVTAEISPKSVALCVFFLFVPTVSILSILVAFLIGSWHRLPIEHRRRIYPKLAIYPTFIAIAIHAPFTIHFLLSPHPRLIADVWFGSLRPSVIFALMLLVSLLPLFFIVLISAIVERKLYGQPEIPPVTVEGQAAQRKYLVLLLLLFITATVITVSSLLTRNLLALAIGLVLMIVGQWLGYKLQKRMKRFIEDVSLTERVKELAMCMEVVAPKVKVDASAFGQHYAFAILRPFRNLVISQKALEVLEPDELDSVLAHELAHLKLKHPRWMTVVNLVGFALVTAPFALSCFTKHCLPKLTRFGYFTPPCLHLSSFCFGFSSAFHGYCGKGSLMLTELRWGLRAICQQQFRRCRNWRSIHPCLSFTKLKKFLLTPHFQSA